MHAFYILSNVIILLSFVLFSLIKQQKRSYNHEKRIQRVEKKALTTKDKDSVLEYEALKLIKVALEEGKPARSVTLNDNQELLVKSFNLLTKKPTIFVANVGEEHIANP